MLEVRLNGGSGETFYQCEPILSDGKYHTVTVVKDARRFFLFDFNLYGRGLINCLF